MTFGLTPLQKVACYLLINCMTNWLHYLKYENPNYLVVCNFYLKEYVKEVKLLQGCFSWKANHTKYDSVKVGKNSSGHIEYILKNQKEKPIKLNVLQ